MTHGKNICNQLNLSEEREQSKTRFALPSRGKVLCEALKEVRKRIAEENDIPLEIEECTFKGECRGTCPRCEAEVRYLENALADRLRIGKVATVAGLALGLAATAQAQAPQTDVVPLQDTTKTHKEECLGTLKGVVIDIKTNEPLPFVNVILKQDGKQVLAVTTDLDGLYTLKPIPFGNYTLLFTYIHYRHFEHDVTINKTGFTIMDVGLVHDSAIVLDSCRIINRPIIEIGSPMIPSEFNQERSYEPREAIGQIQVNLPGTPASKSEPDEQPAFYDDNKQGVKVIVR